MDKEKQFVKDMLKSAEEDTKPKPQFMEADKDEIEDLVEGIQKKIQQK